jgi:glucose-6-phosphate 1-epimerase
MNTLTHRPLGAQILQARFADGFEPFYCSPLTAQFQSPARGGVPVLFPQFAEYGPLIKHGFARTLDWTLLEHGADATRERLHEVLEIAQGDHPGWPHAARLELEVLALAQRLEFTFTVLNTGTSEFSFTGGLHPYFAVDDLLAAQVMGLQGLDVSDRYQPEFKRQDAPVLQFTDAVIERLVDGCPAVKLVCGGRTLTLTATGFDQWMVWNPGREGAVALKDLPDEDWRKFICIEPVRVSRPVVLRAGEKFVGSFAVTSD